MTQNTKNATIVFAFAALLMAWPLTAQVANATGDATSDPDCPVTIPGSFAMGNVVPGSDTVQTSEFVMATPGNVDGTLELQVGDWLGVGTRASAVVVLTNVIATDILTINGQAVTAVASGASTNEFDIGVDDAATATNLAAAITTDAQVTTIAGVDPTAVATENVVIIRSDVVGTIGNVAVATADSTITVPAGGLLEDGENTSVKHAESTMTHFTFTSDGSSSQGGAYSSKTAALADTEVLVVVPRTDINQDVKVTFHISGDGTLVALPYSGALQQSLTFTVTCVAV